jgi:hypothetical protein
VEIAESPPPPPPQPKNTMSPKVIKNFRETLGKKCEILFFFIT